MPGFGPMSRDSPPPIKCVMTRVYHAVPGSAGCPRQGGAAQAVQEAQPQAICQGGGGSKAVKRALWHSKLRRDALPQMSLIDPPTRPPSQQPTHPQVGSTGSSIRSLLASAKAQVMVDRLLKAELRAGHFAPKKVEEALGGLANARNVYAWRLQKAESTYMICLLSCSFSISSLCF